MFTNRISGNGAVLEQGPGVVGEGTEQPEGAARTRNEERGEGGKFVKGNKGGPGNPFARQVAELRKAFIERATAERLGRIADKFLDMAEAGNVQAGKLVLSYVLGKPAEQVNPDRLDVEEWEGYKETSEMIEEMPALMTRPTPELPLEVVRTARPGVEADMKGVMALVLEGKGQEHLKKPDAGEAMRGLRAEASRHQTGFSDQKDSPQRSRRTQREEREGERDRHQTGNGPDDNVRQG